MDKQLLRRIPKVDDLLRRPALEALAAAHTGCGTVLCALDARRAQVYSAAFDLETAGAPGFLPSAASSTQPAWCFIPIWGGLL